MSVKKGNQTRKLERDPAWSKYDLEQILQYIKEGKSDHWIGKLMGCRHETVSHIRYRRGIVANFTDLQGKRLSAKQIKRKVEEDKARHRAYMKRK